MNNNYRARLPVPGPDCEDFAPLLPLVGQERLDARATNHLRQHLATCAYCQRELDSYRWLDGALARHFGPAPRGPLAPADIRELTSRAYRPRTTPPEPAPSPRQPRRPEQPFRPTRPQPARRGRRLIPILSAVAAVLIIAAVSLALFESRAAQIGRTAPKTPTPVGTLPSFSDWRVAYVGADGALHAITQNGAADSRASVLPLMDKSGYAIFSAGVSPDGQYFAYGNDQTYIVDLAARTAAGLSIKTVGIIPYGLFWSPDSTRLAISDGQHWGTIDVNTDQETPLPGKSPDAALLGWIDTSHLLGLTNNAANSVKQSLLSVDVSTGAQHTIATVSTAGLSRPVFILSPDGKQALVYNLPPGEGATVTTYTPFVEVIDTASGQKRALPTITRLTSAGLGSPAWKPGTETLAVSVGVQGVSAGLQDWLLDLARDSAIKLPGSGYPLGWAPDTGALVLSSSQEIAVSATPHEISIMPSPSSTSAPPKALTQAAYKLPFVGFARTAGSPTPTPTPTTAPPINLSPTTTSCDTITGPTLPAPGPGTPVPTIPLTTWAVYNADGLFTIKYPAGWRSDDGSCGVGHLDVIFTNYDMSQVNSPGLPPGAIKIELNLFPGAESGSQSALDFWTQQQQADQQAVGGPACPSFTTRQLQVAGRAAVEGGCPALRWDSFIIPDGKNMLDITESAANGIPPSDVLTQMVNSLTFTS